MEPVNKAVAEQLLIRLESSFNELKQVIERTRTTLAQKENVPQDVFARVDYYREMVAKQEIMSGELRAALERQDWAEVNAIVKRINGLSAMIRDDANDMLKQYSFR